MFFPKYFTHPILDIENPLTRIDRTRNENRHILFFTWLILNPH